MKQAHTIALSVFAKPGENEQAIKDALLSLLPFGLEAEKLQLRRTVASASLPGQDDLVIYEIALDKERHTGKFLECLKEKLGEAQCRELASQENRVDENCFFYLRLDKQKLLEGKYALTDAGSCFHIKMSLAAFPKKREAALKVAKRIFT
jgi:hypothetical protein